MPDAGQMIEIDSTNRPKFKKQYENFIEGEWVAPVDGGYFENMSP